MNKPAVNVAVQALHAVSVGVQVRQRWILEGVDVAIPQAAWTAIVGPNGAGKSTLLRALAGLQPLARGHVELLGQPLAQWGRRARARQLAWLGQGEAVPADLSSYDVAMLGRLPHQGWLATPDAADHAAVAQALHATHAWAWRERPLAELSGGERQRVLLARALATQAPVLLMDEPLANLDPPHQSDWMATVRQRTARGATVVSVLHELGIALQADRLIVLQAGRVLHQGATADAATRAALEAVFDHRIRVRQVEGLWMALPG
ncbi:Ferric enterobactin transport ATP-binding protein FepC [uncultured Comamonas sp.]|nr:Ferric enterobactin transport ATP-binding protein FepC [uncultured Comamonas sp.]